MGKFPHCAFNSMGKFPQIMGYSKKHNKLIKNSNNIKKDNPFVNYSLTLHNLLSYFCFYCYWLFYFFLSFNTSLFVFSLIKNFSYYIFASRVISKVVFVLNVNVRPYWYNGYNYIFSFTFIKN